jgi:hypothetical protein
MSGEHHTHDTNHGHEHHGKNETFFEDSTVAIGFVYTILALGVILGIYIFG